MNFTIEDNKIVYRNEGNTLAYISLDFTPDGLVILEKVFVDPSLRGQGVAGKIMTFAAKHFKDEKIQVVPLCSYANAWYLKHDEYLEYAKMPEDGPICKL